MICKNKFTFPGITIQYIGRFTINYKVLIISIIYFIPADPKKFNNSENMKRNYRIYEPF